MLGPFLQENQTCKRIKQKRSPGQITKQAKLISITWFRGTLSNKKKQEEQAYAGYGRLEYSFLQAK